MRPRRRCIATQGRYARFTPPASIAGVSAFRASVEGSGPLLRVSAHRRSRPQTFRGSSFDRKKLRSPRSTEKGIRDHRKSAECCAWLNRMTRHNPACASALCRVAAGAPIEGSPRFPELERSSVSDILLWVALISAVLGAGWAAVASSGAGRMWHTDMIELRRQQRFRHVLSRHADATQAPRQEAAAVTDGAVGKPLPVSACTGCGAVSGRL